MNRIQRAIDRMKAQIEERIALGMTTRERVARTGRDLDLTATEHARFQELKSVAFASGVLSLEEAQLLFRLLGASPASFNKRDVATKAVLTQTFQELLQAQMAAK